MNQQRVPGEVASLNVQLEASRRDSERAKDGSKEALAVIRKELTMKARKHSPLEAA